MPALDSVAVASKIAPVIGPSGVPRCETMQSV
jgi:hypothetical protein